jgi:hypothetical protein
MDDFVEDAFSEITEMERRQIEGDAKVKTAILSRSNLYGNIDLNGVNVKFRLTINKRLRKKLLRYKTNIDSGKTDVSDSEKVLYDILSSLSAEEPWNNWKTWSVFDDNAEEVGAQEVLTTMMQQIRSHVEDVKNFRGVNGGTNAPSEMQMDGKPAI